ncbi:MAG TPA: response regulator [Planctomycetota bacterium]|nr:response regulator [Planctomycetota bacterium]
MTSPAPSVIHQILLIENDAQHAQLIRNALSTKANLRVHILPDVVTAIRFLAKRDGFVHAPTPDFILVDFDLPYFSGTVLLEERRRRPHWSSVPVVMLSRSVDDRLDCLAHGADGHVVKPADATSWRRLVEEVLVRHLPLATL